MAEVLIVAQDRNVPESWGKWRKGDPVAVFPDGWPWGAREGLPRFVIVRVNAGVQELRDLLDEPATTGRKMWPMVDAQVDQCKETMEAGGIREFGNLSQFRAVLNRRDP